MFAKDCMSPHVQLVAAKEKIQSAAAKMDQADCGALPVAEGDRLIGMVTDRDIVTRCVSAGFDPNDCTVEMAMSPKVYYCYEDHDIEDVAFMMSDLQVRRMPVLSREKRLVGIISASDITKVDRSEISQHSFEEVAQIH